MLDKKQLVWRCRRGVRELDVLLSGFLEQQYDQLSASQQLSFEELLAQQDPIIMDWLFGRERCHDSGMQEIIDLLQLQSGLK